MKKFIAILLLCSSFAVIAGGGPDDYGYYWVDDEDGLVEFDWIEPDMADEAVFPSYDDDFVGIPLPFPVIFYGETYATQIFVSTNGLLGFISTSMDAYFNQPIPTSSAPNAIIAPYWDDMALQDGISHLYYQTEGTAPNRSFVVTWVDWFFLGSYSDPEDPLTFQAIIYESADGEENEIKFQYLDPYGGDLWDANGISATVGIECHEGIMGLQYSYNEASLDSGRAILFFKPPPSEHDCAVNAIVSPFGNKTMFTPIEVSAIVQNRGSMHEPVVPVYFDIADSAFDTVYSETMTISLDAGEIDTLLFPEWMPDRGGTYRVHCRIDVAGDTITINDYKTATVVIWEHISFGGPDSAGYVWFSSYNPEGPVYVEPPSLIATPVPELYGDDEYHQIPLPFTFTFYDEEHDEIWVSTNGWATFGPDPGSSFFSNHIIPSASGPAGGMLAPFWDDHDADTVFDTSSSVRIHDDGESFWIIWYNIYCPYVFTDPGDQVTFAVRLFPSGIVEFHYEDAHTPMAPLHDYGGRATIGIENPSKTDGLLYSFNGDPPGNPLFDRFAIRFLPPWAGPDTTGPVIVHEALEEIYSDPPDFCVELVARISDFSGVETESLFVTDPFVLAVPSDGAVGSNYRFTVCGLFPGDTLWYYFTATDTEGNRSRSGDFFAIVQDPHTGGPDMMGYYFADNWATWDTMAPTYSWVEINPDSGGPGEHVVFPDGELSSAITVGGMFPFYAAVGNQIVICKNGWLSTEALTDAGSPIPEGAFPNPAEPNALIAPLWMRLTFVGGGAVSFWDDTTARRFIVQWDMFDSLTTFAPLIFQTIVEYGREGSWIIFNYKNTDGLHRSNSAVMIEDQYGIDGLAYLWRGAPEGAYVPKEGTSVLFYNPTLYGIEEKPELPEELALSAHPNPFNTAVSIDIRGAVEASRLDIFDISGRVVRSFELSAGRNRLIWNGDTHAGDGLPSGIYFARLKSDGETLSKRLLLVK